MRIVLDTNVLVSGLLSPFGPPGEIVRLVSSGSITLCVDARVVSEYEEVLLRPRFGFEPDDVHALIDFIESRSDAVASQPLRDKLPDRDDEPFLEVAIAADADHLVTGNTTHFPPETCGSVNVLSPADFVEAYRTRPLED